LKEQKLEWGNGINKVPMFMLFELVTLTNEKVEEFLEYLAKHKVTYEIR